MTVEFSNTEIAFNSLTDQELLRAYWLYRALGIDLLAKVGPKAVGAAISLRLPIRWLIKRTVFQQFVGGTTLAECQEVMDSLKKYGIDTILDFASERNTSEKQFERCANEVIASIHSGQQRPEIAFVVFKTSAMAPFTLLQKISAGEQLTEAEHADSKRLHKRVEQVCGEAHAAGVRLFIDAEESWIQKAIDDMAVEMMRRFNKDKAIIYTTVQMYRTDRLEYLQWLQSEAKKGGFKIGVKLVRGAYMEKERDRAREHGYRSPIQPNKQATDRDYNLALRFCCDHMDEMALCVGTHNEESTALMLELMNTKNIRKNDERIYFSQLYGMSDNLTYNLAHDGYRVAKYVPYGPIDAAMPYLFRRAQENTSMQNQASRQLILIENELRRRSVLT